MFGGWEASIVRLYYLFDPIVAGDDKLYILYFPGNQKWVSAPVIHAIFPHNPIDWCAGNSHV